MRRQNWKYKMLSFLIGFGKMPEIRSAVTTGLRYVHVLFYDIKNIVKCSTV